MLNSFQHRSKKDGLILNQVQDDKRGVRDDRCMDTGLLRFEYETRNDVADDYNISVRKILFFLLIFFLPTQLGFHFWPDFSKVAGFKVDYLSPTIYVFDLLFLINIFFTKNRNFLKLPKTLYLACLINLIYVKFSPIAVYGWFRLFEYSLFLKYLLSLPNLLQKVKLPLFLITLVIVFLTFAQFATQRSLQGPFYFLGERYFDTATPHLGKIGSLLRPPSLFPHANALAGYLLLVVLLAQHLRFSPLFKRIIILSLFLTFSKTAIFTYFLVFVLHTSLVQNFLVSLALMLLPFLDINSITLNTRRFILYTIPHFKIQDFLFGIGPKGFITNLPNIYPASNITSATLQPLHNLPVLILLELGLLPILIVILNLVILNFVILNLIQDRSRIEFGMTVLFSIIFLTGSLDHYWWTLPQATLSFILTFVLLFRYGLRRNSNTH